MFSIVQGKIALFGKTSQSSLRFYETMAEIIHVTVREVSKKWAQHSGKLCGVLANEYFGSAGRPIGDERNEPNSGCRGPVNKPSVSEMLTFRFSSIWPEVSGLKKEKVWMVLKVMSVVGQSNIWDFTQTGPFSDRKFDFFFFSFYGDLSNFHTLCDHSND